MWCTCSLPISNSAYYNVMPSWMHDLFQTWLASLKIVNNKNQRYSWKFISSGF